MRRSGFLLAGALLVAAFATGRAEAGTAQVVGGTIQFQAAAGEQNHVVFSLPTSDLIGIEDTGAPISAGPGCSAVTANEVTCAGDVSTPLDADLGDGDDYASNTGAIDNAILAGGDGNDHLVGGDQSGDHGDILFGEAGDDVLQGGAGWDILDGGNGADTMDGGLDAVPDVAYYEYRTTDLTIDLSDGAPDGGPEDGVGDTLVQVDTIRAGSGNDTLVGSDRDEELDGWYGNDSISGGAGNDFLWGQEGDDVLDGGLGADQLLGGGGFNTVDYSSRVNPVFVTPLGGGPDGEAGENDDVGEGFGIILTGSGNDVITGYDYSEVIVSGPGDDQIDGAVGDDEIYAGPGNDTVNGGNNDDALIGGPGADTLQGGDGEDLVSYEERSAPISVDLDGQSGDDGEAGEGDTVFADVEDAVGGSGADALTGNASDNALIGNGGADSLSGLAGNDFLQGGLGADTISGGDGLDAVAYTDRSAAVSVDLDGQTGDDGEPGEGDTTQGDVEDIVGGAGDDLLVGNDTANVIVGGAGNDRLKGFEGVDLFDAGAGNDTVESRDLVPRRRFLRPRAGLRRHRHPRLRRGGLRGRRPRCAAPPPPPPPPPPPAPPRPVRCVVPKFPA